MIDAQSEPATTKRKHPEECEQRREPKNLEPDRKKAKVAIPSPPQRRSVERWCLGDRFVYYERKTRCRQRFQWKKECYKDLMRSQRGAVMCIQGPRSEDYPPMVVPLDGWEGPEIEALLDEAHGKTSEEMDDSLCVDLHFFVRMYSRMCSGWLEVSNPRYPNDLLAKLRDENDFVSEKVYTLQLPYPKQPPTFAQVSNILS